MLLPSRPPAGPQVPDRQDTRHEAALRLLIAGLLVFGPTNSGLVHVVVTESE